MNFKNISLTLKNDNFLQLPSNQNLRHIHIDPNEYIIKKSDQLQNFDVTLICYKIYLLQGEEEIFVYLFKNIHPTSIWYNKKIRDGDRLITLNDENVTRISSENIYSTIIEKNIPFTCQIVWHPELYIQFGDIKNIDQNKTESNISQGLIGIDMYEHLKQILRNIFDYQPREIPSSIDSYSFAQQQYSLLSNIEGNSEEIMKNILLFEQIGIGLNRDEIFWIWISMKTLLNEKPDIQKLRFWGKIFGIKNNYYIVEVDSEIFYVSTVDQSFVQLPIVTFAQIESSRRIQQFFTGDLEAPILSDSSFEGVEKHLLHAQIQRISSGTQIGPNKSIMPDKSDINKNTLENLAKSNGEYWVHCNKEENTLSSINKDALINESYPAWSVGIASTLVPEHALVSVRSNRWPGAFTVGDRYHFENIYIGWGIKNSLENQQANLLNIFPETEYEFQLLEIDDPTIEEENDLFKSSILFSPDENEQYEIDNSQ